MVQLSHPYMTTGKAKSLTMWLFVGKAISLLSNMLSSIVSRWQRATENEMAGRHHQCNGHELGQTLEDGGRQGGLACCSPWGDRVRQDLATEQQLVCQSFLSKDQASFYFMAVIIVHGDFRAQERKICASAFSPSVCHEVMGPDAMILGF